jgi:hypothetical protein
MQNIAYKLPNGGMLTIAYKNATGGQIEVDEGNWCPSLAPGCWTSVSNLGAANFGDRAGSLHLVSSSPLMYGLWVSPGTTHGYHMLGMGMTQANFKAWAAAMVKVPRP